MLNTPFPAFPQGGRSKNKLFPLGGNEKGGNMKWNVNWYFMPNNIIY
jgi:hypothetical protein